MSSTVSKSYLGPIRIALFSLILIATLCAAGHYVLPNIREGRDAEKRLGVLKGDNAVLAMEIDKLRKNRTEFQNNNIDFIILTGHREGLIGPNEKLFEFTEPANKK